MDRLPPLPRPSVPSFATVGRPPPGGATALSRGLILFVAIGVFAAGLALVWQLQQGPPPRVGVEVTMMEDEAEAAEQALQAAPAPEAEPAP